MLIFDHIWFWIDFGKLLIEVWSHYSRISSHVINHIHTKQGFPVLQNLKKFDFINLMCYIIIIYFHTVPPLEDIPGMMEKIQISSCSEASKKEKKRKETFGGMKKGFLFSSKLVSGLWKPTPSRR